MINYYPTLYPDELMYSYLARLGVHNGYWAYNNLSQDLYGHINYTPSIEFMNKLQPDVEVHILHGQDIKSLIEGHTMYSFYGGFMKEAQKRNAMQAITEGTGEYYKVLPMIKRNRTRYLRVCPMCVQQDKNKYGEAYWHMTHQMIGIDVCNLHGCCLYDSKVQISADKSVKLITAEEILDDDLKVSAGTDIEIQLARYVVKVLQGVHKYPDKDIAEFLDQKLIGTKYLSKRGDHRYITRMCEDFTEYYKDVKDIQPLNTYKIHIEGILKRERIDFLEICMWSKFLGVSEEELIKCEIWEKNSRKQYTREFDKMVLDLLNSGLGVNEVSRQLGISSRTTGDIKDGKFAGSNAKRRGKGGKFSRDWDKLDRELLPQVLALIEQFKEDTEDRPKRVTMSSIGHSLHIPFKNFDNLPLCRTALKQNTENINEYWAREMVWAIKKIKREGRDMHLTNIMKLTNQRKRDVFSSVEYMQDEECKKIIEGCLN